MGITENVPLRVALGVIGGILIAVDSLYTLIEIPKVAVMGRVALQNIFFGGGIMLISQQLATYIALGTLICGIVAAAASLITYAKGFEAGWIAVMVCVGVSVSVGFSYTYIIFVGVGLAAVAAILGLIHKYSG